MKKIFGWYLMVAASFLLFPFATTFAQYGTPVMDGTTSAAEYTGNSYSVAGGSWLMTWNNTDLYFGKVGGNPTHAMLIFLDFDGGIPVNYNATGPLTGTSDFGYAANLPFSGTLRVYWSPGTGFAEVSIDNAGSWVILGTTATLAPLIETTNGTNSELRLSWSLVGSRPGAFNALMYQIDNSSLFVYHAAPDNNPTGNITGGSAISPNHHFYFTIPQTTDPTALDAFGNLSFTQFNLGEYVMNLPSKVFYDVTINDNSTDNNDNASSNNLAPTANRIMVQENFEVAHNLYIGQGSALFPQVGLNRTVTMSGTNGSIWNYGRLDANPNISSLADVNLRRLSFVFSGQTTIQPSPLFIDHFRFSSITVLSGASLLAAVNGTAEFEVAWGLMTVDGTLDLYNSTIAYVNVVLRGVVTPLMNDYFVTGAGSLEFHDLIVGRDSARLQPLASATADTVELRVMGDLGIYGGFEGRSNQAVLGVCMCGTELQTIGGHVDQTFNQAVAFSLLKINNNNGLSNANAGADVHFVTYDSGTPGTIDYFVDGRLTLLEGDLVTREGGSCNAGGTVHQVTILDGASISFLDSVSNDFAGNGPSSYIDGPIRRVVSAASLTKVDFPVGKAGAGRDIQFNLLHSDATPAVYVAELSDCPPPAYSMAPTAGAPAFELLSIRPQPRYWQVAFNPDGTAGAPSVTQAGVKMFFDSDDVSGATDPGALRVIKDDGAGGYVNYGGSAATLGPDQIPSTFNFNNFGIFTLGLPPVLRSQDSWELAAEWKAEKPFLQWNSPDEPVSRFEIWRSQHTNTWSPVGTCQQLDFQDLTAFEPGQPMLYRVLAYTTSGEVRWSNTVELLPLAEQGRWYVQSATSHEVRVIFEGFEGPYSLQLVNAHGQMMESEEGQMNGNGSVALLPANRLAAGVYWVIRSGNGFREVKAILIQEK